MISSGHFRVDTGPALRWTSSVRWAYAHFLREWRRGLAQSSEDAPDWKWAASSALSERLVPRALGWTCQTKQAGAVPILSGKMKEAASSCQVFHGGRPPPVCRTCDKVSRLT